MHRIDVHKLADEAKFNRFHAVVLLWCVLIIIIDGYDIAVAGVALPSIMKDMGVDASTAGFMAGSALFGMMFGAIFLGALADKIGRRWTISICVALFSVFTAAAGFTNDPVTFSVMRFIAGLGIGGVMPNIVAQMTEYSPQKIRGRMVTVMFSGYAVGGILAALSLGWKKAMQVGMGMVPRGEVGIVVAQIGSGLAAVTDAAYGVVLFMAIATTLIAPPFLKRLYKGETTSVEPSQVTLPGRS